MNVGYVVVTMLLAVTWLAMMLATGAAIALLLGRGDVMLWRERKTSLQA